MANVIVPDGASLLSLPRLNPAHPLSRGLVLWLLARGPMVNATQWRDLSPYRNHAFLIDAGALNASRGFGGTTRPGGAAQYNFDGTTPNWGWVPHSPSLSGAAGFTVGTWFALATPSVSERFLLTKRYSGEPYSWQLVLYANGSGDSGYLFIDTPAGGALTETLTNLLPGVWYHLVGTYDRQTLRLYLNGKLESSATLAIPPPATAGDVLLGIDPFGGGAWMAGAMDDIRVYDYALPAPLVELWWRESFRRQRPWLLPAPRPASRGVQSRTVTITPARRAWQARQITLTSPPIGQTPGVRTDLNTYEMGGRAQFYLQTFNPDTGAAWDADALPTYRVYEEATGTPLLTGGFSLFDGANTAGFYAAEFVIDGTLGFEAGKVYVIRAAWTILDASEASLEPFTLRSTVVSVRPAKLTWKAQNTSDRRVLTLTPARWRWQAASLREFARALLVSPARWRWQGQGILGRIVPLTPARWRWQAQAITQRPFGVVRPVGLSWAPGHLELVAPFPPGTDVTAVSALYIAGDWLIRSQRLQLKLSLAYNPDGTWEHRLLDLSDIETSVAWAGGLASVGTVSFTIAEDGQGMSILERWRRFATIGGTSDITVDFLTGQTDALRLVVRVFTGIIDTISLKNGRSTIHCVDESIQRNLQLPQALVTSNLYALAGSAALTQPIPLVYGYGSHLRAAPLLLTNTSSLGYTAAAHAMSMTQAVALFNTDAQVFMSGTVVALPVDHTATVFLSTTLQQQLLNQTSSTMVLLSQQATTFPEAAIDRAANTIARVNTTQLASNGDGMGFLDVVATPTPQQRGNNQAVITLTNHRRAAQSAPTTTGQFLVQTVDMQTGQTLREALFTTQNFRHALTPQTTVQTITNLNLGAQEAVEIRLLARNEGGAGAATDFYEIQEMLIQTAYQPSGDTFAVYLVGEFNGRRDGTGTVAPGGAGTLYTLPNHIIGSLLVDELHVPLGMGMLAANTTYLQRNYTFAGGVGFGWQVTRAPARQLLDDAARQAAAICLQDLTGAWSLRPFDPTALPALVCDVSTILCEDGAEAATASDATEIILGNMEQVHCRFEIHYAWNPGAQKFDEMVYAYENGSNVPERNNLRYRCQLSAIRYGITEPLIIQAYWISTRTAAVLLLEHLVNYFSFQRILVTFSTTLRAIGLRLGDLVRLTHPLLPAGDTGGDFEVHSLRVSPLAGRIQLTASKRATVYLEYFTIRDQAGVVWYWWFDEAGQLVRDNVLPDVPPLTNLDVTGESTVPYWHRVQEASGMVTYLYPDTLGQLVIDTTPPPSGVGQDTGLGLTAIALNARRYRLSSSGDPAEILVAPVVI